MNYLENRRTLLIIAVTGFAFSLAWLFYSLPASSIQSNLAMLVENTERSRSIENAEQGRSAGDIVVFPEQFGLSLRLKIPGINVDAAFEYVNLTPDGTMAVPESQDDVAWFDLGPRPGENGSAVIAGHYGRKNGRASVFDNLYKLREGDKLYVEDEKGAVISFVVRKIRRYDPEADASDVFVSSDENPHLNLITCDGAWDKTQKSYADRLVVFSDKEIF